ncbi:MAG TPA: TonB-dependent receptor [Candidatus Acidoferrum sp.]|nr:TonB-dependent receptor [Candidatus Acidoferrum sp.]
MSVRTFPTLHLFSSIAAVFVIVGILFSVPASAQVTGGTLSGTITDPSERAIPQAQVAITNVATGVTTTVTTNTEGYFTAPNLRPGDYDVTFSAKGFTTETRTGISLTVGMQQVFNLVLKVGSAKTVVEVTTEAPAVQLASSDISAVVNATTVRELPLNGRSWTDLAALQAGVETIQTQPTFATGADRGNRGFGQQLTISGARPQQNNYRLDGVSLNDYANGAPGSVLGGNLGVDAIQEFSVLTSNYSAEYGKTSGGVVNAITRQGTNAFHGSAYEFLRNSKLDAANFFEAGQRTPFKRNQFGGAIGGPIIKNRTFFFADYEGIRQSKGIANVDFVPSAAALSGVLCSNPAGAPPSNPCTTTKLTPGPNTDSNGIDLEVKKYLVLYPIAQGAPIGNGDVAPFTFSAQQIINENFVTTRVDHRFSSKDGIFGTYLYDKTPYSSPDSFGNVLLGSLSSRQIVAAEETHSFTPTFVNAVRFGYNHENVNNNQSLSAINPAAVDAPSCAMQTPPTCLGAFAGRNAAFVNVTGLSPMSGGVGGLPTYFYRWNSFQGYDDAFFNRGTHAIKFGFAFERLHLQATALTDPNGIWTFGDIGSFLTNAPTKFQGGIASSLTPRNFRQSIIGGYVQDDWRTKPNLTLNLGLRYEMATVPTETNGKLVNLRNITDLLPICGVLVAGSCSGTGPLFSNPTLHNFEPRIGFAWDPFHNGKMAVRGGAGLFDVLPLPYEFILMETQAIPFFQYTTLKVGASPPPTCPPGTMLTFPLVTQCLITGNKLRSTFIDSNPNRNYVMQWNLNVQYQLTQNLAAMIAYVGSRGVHQPFRVDEADLITPPTLQKTSAGYLWPKVDVFGNVWGPGCMGTDPNGPADAASCAPPNPINPNFGSIRGMFYQGRSYFNALELQLARRMSHGFQMQGTFTWGRSIDTSSATVAGDAFGNSISSLNYFDMRLTRGPSDFNVNRTLVLNGTWEVPAAKSLSGPARWLTDGWELGLILTVSDGVPFTPTWGTGSDPAGTLSSDDFAFPDRLGGSGCHSLTNTGNPANYIKTQCFTVPSAPDPTFWNAHCDPAPPSAQNPSGTPPVLASFPQCFNLRGNSGRNIMIGPGITNLDFSVFKNNHIKRISESFNVQFRMEIFNILNHANFAPPGPGDGNTDIFDGTGSPNPIGGVLVRTTIPERQIQFAIKFIF